MPVTMVEEHLGERIHMQTFLQFYEQEIQPPIRAIDIFLKTETQPYNHQQVADLLCVSKAQLLEIMQQEKLAIITKGTFFHIMQSLPSFFCKMFCREISCGVTSAYSLQEISYIYDLEPKAVEVAAKKIGKFQFFSAELPMIFEEIMISDKQYRF